MRSHAPLITVDELKAGFDEATILDASWIYGPFNYAQIDVRRRYAQAHIRCSWFLDLAALSDPARKCEHPRDHARRAAPRRRGVAS